MKHIPLILLVLISFSQVCIAQVNALNTLKETKHIESLNCVSIKYPTGWSPNLNIENLEIYLRRPLSGTSDPLRENVNVGREQLKGSDPTEAFKDYMLKVKNILAGSIGEFELESMEIVELDNYHAYELVFTGYYQNTIACKWKQDYFFYGGWVYIVSYVADRDEYDEFHNVAYSIMRTVKVEL